MILSARGICALALDDAVSTGIWRDAKGAEMPSRGDVNFPANGAEGGVSLCRCARFLPEFSKPWSPICTSVWLKVSLVPGANGGARSSATSRATTGGVSGAQPLASSLGVSVTATSPRGCSDGL